MKRIIALFTMLMFLGAGTVMGQVPQVSPSNTAGHNVELNIEDWSYVDLNGGDVVFNVNTLTDGENFSSGKMKYSDNSTSLKYGTNSDQQVQLQVSATSTTSGDVEFFLRPNSVNAMTLDPHQWTLGSAGSFVAHQDELGPSPDQFITGIYAGGGEVDPLIYEMWVQFFESNESGDYSGTVTYTLTANN